MSTKTRHEAGTSLADVTGPGEPMAQTELPTLRGVLKHAIYLQEKKLLEEGVDRRNYSIKQLSRDVTMEVVSCWQRANAQFRPPVIFKDRSIERNIQVAWTALEKFSWNRGGMKREEDRKNFLDNLDSFFNIASCSHEILPCSELRCEGCQEGAYLLDCNCKRKKKDIYTMTDADGRFLDHFIKEKVPDDSTMSSSQPLALQVFQWCTEYGVSDTLD